MKQILVAIDGFKEVQLYGTDYTANSIGWCEKYIKGIELSKNMLEPPLIYQSESFDCVYAISIFSHLSEENHFIWLKELNRILKPGGILIITTHSDLCAERLNQAEKEKYDFSSIVVRGKINEGKKHYATYHPHKYMREVLLKDYSVLEHIQNDRDYFLDQEVWVIQK